MMIVDTVNQKTHNAEYQLKRETTRDVIYFTTYRQHAKNDVAFYSGNTMTGIVRNLETDKLRNMIEKAESDSDE